MFMNSGYLGGSRLPIKDKSKPLIVTSCGTYRLKTLYKLPTWRPRGRLDYQLLYVAAGKTHFYMDGTIRQVSAGQMVLYQPRQEQRYDYFGIDNPEVYWVHFTGSDVKNILRSYDIPLDTPVFFSGISGVYPRLFKEMIAELQTCRTGYEELLAMYLRQILLQVQRTRQTPKSAPNARIQEEMETVARYLKEHYPQPLTIQEVAAAHQMSVSWLQRNFREIYHTSPLQYLIAIRLEHAATLLETTHYTVADIAALVGYDDPLYFSRLFRKGRNVSPTQYRKPGGKQ